MPIVDLATLVMEVRDLYLTALQVHSPALRMMLTMPLPSSVATKQINASLAIVIQVISVTGTIFIYSYIIHNNSYNF